MTTTTSATQSATKGLLDALGSGSGVDTGSLVTSLVQAQFAAQTARLTKRAETLTAQISGVSTVRSAITGFATALDTLAKGGTLATAPRSSSTAVATATALPGARLAALSSTVEVGRLATAQAAATAAITAGGANATRATVLGSGSFTLQLGTAAFTTTDSTTTMGPLTPAAGKSVTFSLTDATIDTIAAAINDKGAALGISAAVVTGADGSAYLSLKGATGAASAFTLQTSGDAALEQFRVGENAPTTLTAKPGNAQLTVDGVAVERASNTVSDLITGVKLELAGTGTTTLSFTRPTAALTQAVIDVVDTYNQVVAILAEQTDAVSGTLKADPAAKALLRGLRAITLSTVNPNGTGAPATLAELGIKTARDGTLSVDSAQLSAVLAAHPDAVEAMFQSSTTSTTGLPAALARLSTQATNPSYGLAASATRYTAAQGELGTAQTKLTEQSDAMTTRLTSQYAAMNARVSAYKSVQGFLDNQIAAWNKSDS